MAEKKIPNTKFQTVIVESANPEAKDNMPVNFVGGNNIIIDGIKEIKHYKFQLGKEISIPEPFVKQLEDRHYVVGDAKTGEARKIPIYRVRKV